MGPSAFAALQIAVRARVRTCVQPDLGQGHPGVQGSLLGGAALQRRGNLGQGLLHSARRDGRGVNGAWADTIAPLEASWLGMAPALRSHGTTKQRRRKEEQ